MSGPTSLATLLKRSVVGVLGSLFGFPCLWIAVSSITEPAELDRVFPIPLLPTMIAFGIAAGWGAAAATTPIRTLAWGIAGLGAGFVLDGLLGCLDAGEVVGPSTLVLALAFVVIGYREAPARCGTG